MSKRGILIFLSILSGMALSTTGCVFHRAVSADAVSYNVAVERAQNRMLLLNIVRAMHRSPMYVSGIQKVTGSIKAEATVGLGIPFGGGSDDKYSASPGGTYSWGPTFDVSVLDTEEFMRGFLAPIPIATFAYYVDQGWPQDLLIHLMVHKIEVLRDDNPKILLENAFEEHQTEQPGWTAFSREVGEVLRKARLAVRWESRKVASGSSPTVPQAIEAIESGYSFVTEGTSSVAICRNVPVLYLESRKAPSPVGAAKADTTDVCAADGTYRPGTVRLEGLETIFPDVTEIRLLLRSPEAMLYYLGEIARIENDDAFPATPLICSGERLQPLFFAGREESGCRQGAVEIDYGGDDYLIPSRALPLQSSGMLGRSCVSGEFELLRGEHCTSGRSLQALSLISQVLSLQKSSEDLPTTQVVRVIGQ